MRYMKELIEDPMLSFAQKWSRKSKRTSDSQEQIDEVRIEWSEFVTRKYL
ncbi:hypothetical protein RchiOBHm_Chr2g0112151 [Rosa chinensis]|uniref:Uncharacterized protein n=1 Tax=Rosa chinensis TaxID=74649 RepID=A0A2P6RQ45_ROSCH|nr:hypothetical protein RchiOBHm_Chr2g0112151 [Rosa chinensis]